MRIIPVPVREDNYAYIVMSTPKGARPQGAFVDPYDVPTVRRAAHTLGLQDTDIVGSITTHGHYDHAGGNDAFAKTFPGRPIWGGAASIASVTHVVRDGDTFELFSDGAKVLVKAYATPCHTRDSICFFVEDERSEDTLAQLPHGLKEGADGEKKRGVFTGDTLFISGCGRFFEGQAEDMHRALNVVLRQLPLDTLVYCGHEYGRCAKGSAAHTATEKHVEEVFRVHLGPWAHARALKLCKRVRRRTRRCRTKAALGVSAKFVVHRSLVFV